MFRQPATATTAVTAAHGLLLLLPQLLPQLLPLHYRWPATAHDASCIHVMPLLLQLLLHMMHHVLPLLLLLLPPLLLHLMHHVMPLLLHTM